MEPSIHELFVATCSDCPAVYVTDDPLRPVCPNCHESLLAVTFTVSNQPDDDEASRYEAEMERRANR